MQVPANSMHTSLASRILLVSEQHNVQGPQSTYRGCSLLERSWRTIAHYKITTCRTTVPCPSSAQSAWATTLPKLCESGLYGYRPYKQDRREFCSRAECQITASRITWNTSEKVYDVVYGISGIWCVICSVWNVRLLPARFLLYQFTQLKNPLISDSFHSEASMSCQSTFRFWCTAQETHSQRIRPSLHLN